MKSVRRRANLHKILLKASKLVPFVEWPRGHHCRRYATILGPIFRANNNDSKFNGYRNPGALYNEKVTPTGRKRTKFGWTVLRPWSNAMSAVWCPRANNTPASNGDGIDPTRIDARGTAPAPPAPKPVQPPSTGNDSKPDVVQIVIVDHIQKSPKAGNKDMPDTDKCAASPKQNNSMKETRTSAKDTRSTKEQGTGVNRTDGSSRPRKFEPRNEAERKQLEDIKKGKFGNTIDDDTLNDADHEWGEGDVIYKADRTKKKKKRR